jgi:hypothetical protein
MPGTNVTPLEAPAKNSRRQHARSRLAGRLFAAFDILCSATREARDNADDRRCPIMRRLGGRNELADGSPLHDAMMAICEAAVDLMQAAEPDEDRAGERPAP